MANNIGLDMLREVFEDPNYNWNHLFESEDESKENDETDTDDVKDEEDDIEPSEDDAIVIADSDDSTPPDIDVSEDEDDESSDTILNEIGEKVKLSKSEIEILESLIDSEVDAISDYTKALNETKNKFARKLYTEIISDESKHLSQLKYLKSMGTDSDYIPKDKDANDELAEILESCIEEL